MPNRPTTEDEVLRARLEVAEQTLAAIRAGSVDALVVDGREGRRVYTLDGANQVYRALVEHIEEGACALTPAGVVLFCNGALARLLGRPLRSVIGCPLRELLAAESRDRLAALIGEANAGRPVRGELVVESPTAGAVPVEIALTPFRGFGEASLAGVVSDLRDQRRREVELEARVAERTHALGQALARATMAEREVRERETRLAVAMDAAGQAPWEVDLSTQQMSASSQLGDLLGATGAVELRSWSDWRALVVDEDWPGMQMAFEEALAGDGEYLDEFRIRSPHDGALRWVASRGRVLRDDTGRALRLVGVASDVTRRKEDYEELRRSEVRLRLATEAARIGTWFLDVPGDLLSFSDRCRELYGLSPADPVTVKRVLGTVHPEDRALAREAANKALVEGESTSEYRVVRPDGSVNWLSVHSRTFSSRPGVPVWNVGAVLDVTAQKQYEQQLASFMNSLEANVLQRTAEVTRLADQLRVLAAELSYAELRERKRLARVLHDHVQQLLVAARMQVELARRTNDSDRHALLLGEAESILQEATAASRSLASELSPPVLHEAGLAGGLTWLAARFEEQHRFAVHVQAEADAEPVREEIRSLVFECVRELLLNAVKHSGEREAWVTLAKAPDDRLEIAVRDQGKGFAPDAVRQRPVDELTFGLFSVEQRLAYVGGQMTVDATPGRGTTVRLSAPRGRAPSPPVPVLATPKRRAGGGEPRPGTARERTVRVVLVDDHQVVRQGLAALLRLESGLEVVAEVADGPGVVDAVTRLAPDVVLMDVNLGEMSGIEATRVLTAQHPRVKVIGLSMHVDPEVAQAMCAAGAVAFLAKSGNVRDVVDAIRASVRPKRRPRKQQPQR